MIRAAVVTPVTGPLARFGRVGAVALGVWADRFADDLAVRLTVYDAHPDPVAALRRAEGECPDLLFGPYGSGPARALVTATDRLVWNHGGAAVPACWHVVNLIAPASSYFDGCLRAVVAADPLTRRIALYHGDTGFGRQVGDGAVRVAGQLGVEVSVSATLAEVAAGDMLLVAGRFADEIAAAKRLLPGGWRAAAFVGAGVREVLASLGARREGLLGPAQWLASRAPRPTEGPHVRDFTAVYRQRHHAQPSYPAAQAFAAGLIAARCLRDAGGTADHDLLAAAADLDCVTLFGRFALDPATGAQTGHQLITVQWQDGIRRAVWPPAQAQSTIRIPLPHPHTSVQAISPGTETVDR